jgi:uncharacterized protein YndB with AHSA1/START domain
MNKKSKHTLVVKKLIRAERAKVFAAWTEPELMRRWFFPEGMSLVSSESDVRVGGRFRAALSDGSNTHTVTGTYREIVVGEKLAFTHTWEERDPVEDSGYRRVHRSRRRYAGHAQSRRITQ